MLLLLLNFFLSSAFAGHSHDLPCDATACVIPYDKEGTQNGTEICYTNENKTEKIRELTWKEGKREGPAKCWKNGKLSFEANYRNDVLNGVFIDYDYDSQGDRVWFLENNEESGLSFSVKDGKVTSLAHCVVGGTRLFDTTLSCETNDFGRFNQPLAEYKKELLQKNKAAAAEEARRRNGPQESKYASGKIRAKWTNVDGNIHGKFLSYREDGKTQSDCEFKNGKENGTCLQYDEEGRMDKREIWAGGKRTSVEEFYDNGKLERISKVQSKDKTCITQYFDSGIKSGEWCGFQGNYWHWYVRLDGPYKAWNSDGQLYLEGNYVDGRESGVFTYYDGKVVESEMTYEKGNLLKSINYFSQTPQHRIVREYFPDGSLKNETRLEGLEGDKKFML